MASIPPSDTQRLIATSFADIVIDLTAEGIISYAHARASRLQADILSGLTGTHIDNTLDSPSRKALADIRQKMNGVAQPTWGELTHIFADETQLPVRYAIHRGERPGYLLMVGQDQRPLIDLQQQLVNTQLAQERDREQNREGTLRYRMAMELSQDALMVMSPETRTVIDANAAAADLLGSTRTAVIGASFETLFTSPHADSLVAQLSQPGSKELNIATAATVYDATARMFRAGRDMLIMLRLAASLGSEVQISKRAQFLHSLYEHAGDGILFLHPDGTIAAANAGFLSLISSTPHDTLQGASLSTCLLRGSIDQRVIIETVRRDGQISGYITDLFRDGQVPQPDPQHVSISAAWLPLPKSPMIGLLIRRLPQKAGETGVTSTSERKADALVGKAPLKDIVSETTDVIERLCIETALEMTDNNRVAAAEILGLSRQSLYIKLRKFGLLSKAEE